MLDLGVPGGIDSPDLIGGHPRRHGLALPTIRARAARAEASSSRDLAADASLWARASARRASPGPCAPRPAGRRRPPCPLRPHKSATGGRDGYRQRSLLPGPRSHRARAPRAAGCSSPASGPPSRTVFVRPPAPARPGARSARGRPPPPGRLPWPRRTRPGPSPGPRRQSTWTARPPPGPRTTPW